MVTTQSGPSNEGPFGQGQTPGIVITAAANSVVKTLKVPEGATWLGLQITNTHASVAFDQLDILRRTHTLATYETIANAAGDYSSPQSPILEVQGAPVTLAAAAVCDIGMETHGAESIKILASGAAAASEATISWRFT
jgi:hypothetical protein